MTADTLKTLRRASIVRGRYPTLAFLAPSRSGLMVAAAPPRTYVRELDMELSNR